MIKDSFSTVGFAAESFILVVRMQYTCIYFELFECLGLDPMHPEKHSSNDFGGKLKQEVS